MQMLIVSSGNKLARARLVSRSLFVSLSLFLSAGVGKQIKLMPNECTVSLKFSALGGQQEEE